MKTVFTNDQVAHVWAQQTRSIGRNSNESFYFRDSMIFSYGSHYMAAKIHTIKGKKICIINARGYSPTTGQHLSSIRSAVRDLMPSFEVKTASIDDITACSLELDQTAIDSVAIKLKTVKITSTVELKWAIEYITDTYKNTNDLRKLIGKKPIKVKATDISALKTHYKKRLNRYKELNTPEMIKKREIESAKRKERELVLAVEKFRKGEKFKKDLIRKVSEYDLLRVQGEELVTSGGARVQLVDARRMLMAYKNGIDIVGKSIGHFTIDWIAIVNSEFVIKVGCHKIAMSEVENVLGVA